MAQPKPLSERMTADGPNIYYSEAMRNMLEVHIPYLLSGGRSTLINIEPVLAWEYEYDFCALLHQYDIPGHLHWIAMRMNGLYSPDQYRHDMLAIYVPNPDAIERLKNVEMAIHKIG